MVTIAYYLFQVLLCSALMMGYYWLVLRNKRFHQYNRFYLLAVAVSSWVVPLIKIQWGSPSAGQSGVYQLLNVVADNNSYLESRMQGGFVWSRGILLSGLYTAVSAALLFGMVMALLRIWRLLKENSCRTVGDVFLVITQAKGTPFSFFQYIFWNEEIDIRSESGKQILQHELAHVQQKHSFDRIFLQLMLVVGWFNPFFWLLKKEMEMIHEFIADKNAVKNGDTASLAQMLLAAAYPGQTFALTHPFFFSPIKRRLQMLADTKNPRFSYLRRLLVLPLLAVVVVLFAFRNKEKQEPITLSFSSVVEKMADATGTGSPAIISERVDSFLKKPVISVQDVYIGPKDTVPVETEPAQKINQIKAFKDVLILVDGKKLPRELLSKIDPQKISSVEVLKNESAVAKYGEEGKNGVILVSTKPQREFDTVFEYHNGVWVPATLMVKGTVIPVADLPRTYPDTLIWKSNDAKKSIPDDVLIIVDGAKTKDYNSIKQDDIKSISILKGEDATKQYGQDASKGVIVITTKRNISGPAAGYDSMFSKRNGSDVIAVIPSKETDSQKDYDKLFTQTQVPPSFPGGLSAWTNYLQRNLNRDIPVEKGGPPGKYTVVVEFIVDKEGKLSDIKAMNDPGYGTAAEAVRVIEKGPHWVPATQNGKTVVAKHRQSITWVIAGEELKTIKTGKSKQLSKTEDRTAEKLKELSAMNGKTYFEINGNSVLSGRGGGFVRVDGKTDIIFADGKRISPDELNRKYKREDFIFLAADDTSEIIDKYGKAVLVASSKTLTNEEIKKMLLH